MNGLTLVIVVIVLFLVAYTTYGSWLAKKFGVDPSRKTPAHTMNDGVDYVPAKAPVLLGHHFSSIAGAGPIVGPIGAAIFGWIPVFLWIIIGSIFFGGVHDMGSMFASVRHKGQSIGEVIGTTMGKKGRQLFSIFAWLTLILVIAAFANIVANTFVSVPEAASSSMLFILLAIFFGYAVYRKGVNLALGTVIGVALLIGAIFLGTNFPLSLSKNTWMVILLGYIFVASVTPVWILLQPRDYLNSFLLYAMLIGGVVGIVIMRPTLQLSGVTAFNVNGTYLFPMLFVTVACGAISGFHSLVGSGTTSKQLDNEKDIKVIGYGSMLIEGVLATLAIITAAYVTGGKLTELLGNGGPVNVFSDGLGSFMTSFGLSFTIGKSFTALAISAFAMTTLDTATRLARFIFQEMFTKENQTKETVFTNRYGATAITVIIAGSLSFYGWGTVWPLFGSANQLLAALSLLALAVWLKKNNKTNKFVVLPMIFMFSVTLVALVILIMQSLSQPILLIFSVILFVLAIILILEASKALKVDKIADVKKE
ncbi:carbon starvation protein A [Fusibacter bizertensis]|uniref:Carbon starvation protein A n=1 Tax=Fusibacter bizertensis TaxID=1488331 RepID=A0ABT6NG20_9FIRM|nr:carbon starvation protein A [Fusibacter bizertensis]MDH8679379.1 carbon starvation protein A [Fusibacter bizertensis]